MVGLRTGTRYMGSSSVDGVYVECTIPVTIQLDARGRIEAVERGAPAQEELTEATHFVATLAANQQIGFSPVRCPRHDPSSRGRY